MYSIRAVQFQIPKMEGDAPELKAGHAPAVKVGGMRVVQKKEHKEEKPGWEKLGTKREVRAFLTK